MRLGCDLPYRTDPAEIRAFAQAAEEIGYDHLCVPERIVTAGGTAPAEASYETFTLLGYLSGITSRLELASAMLLLPLRPAALVAKQAAEIDSLSGERLRLGVAVGWNTDETRALGVDPALRGELFEEQVRAMRLLWTRDAVDFPGRHVRLARTALSPRPRRPIPVWMGGGTVRTRGVPPERVLRRISRLADGFTMIASLGKWPDQGARLIDDLLRRVELAGRQPSAFGVEARLLAHLTHRDAWWDAGYRWKRAGATHVTVSGSRAPTWNVDRHIALIADAYPALRPLRDRSGD